MKRGAVVDFYGGVPGGKGPPYYISPGPTVLFGGAAVAVTFVTSGADASSSTTSVTTLPGVTYPSAVRQADDVFILGWASDDAQTETLDAAFTLEASTFDGALRSVAASRVSNGTESGDVSLSCAPTANRQAGAIATYRGSSGTGNVASLGDTAAASTSHPSPSITLASADSGIALIYTERVSSSATPITPPAGFTSRAVFATGGSGGTAVCIADKLTGNSAGSNAIGNWAATTAASAVVVHAIELLPDATAVDLVVAAAAQGHLADNATLTQDHTLGVAAATQEQTADGPALTQVHSLTVQDAIHGQTADVPTLLIVLGVQDAVHAQAADSPTLVQQHAVVVDGAAQAQTAANVALTQDHNLAVDPAAQGLTSDSPTLTQVHNLVVDSAVQAQAVDAPPLDNAPTLVVDAPVQQQTAGAPVLTQAHALAVDAAIQQQAPATPTLTQLHVLAVEAALHAFTSDSPALTQVHVLVPQNAAQGQIVADVAVEIAPAITPRPFDGVTNRPLTGVTARPDTGVTVRP